MGERIVSNQG